MSTIWFMIVAVMVAMYVLLDGFDLGAGAVHLFIAHTDEERRSVIRAVGPVWDGNEVWLLAAAGRCTSLSRCSMPPASADSICR